MVVLDPDTDQGQGPDDGHDQDRVDGRGQDPDPDQDRGQRHVIGRDRAIGIAVEAGVIGAGPSLVIDRHD